MSWPARAGGAAPAPSQRPQAPHQGYNNQQNMYPNYQGAPPTAGNTQQYWQTQQPPYNQQYGQVYQQQEYGNNANQFYQHNQHSQYNQNYPSQGYTDTQQQYTQNYYQSQAAQPPGYQAQPKTDSWEDNWDWGWDEASKQAQQATGQNQVIPPTQPQPQQVYNNANVIEESFASTDTWNWATDDRKEAKEAASALKQEPAVLPVENKSSSEIMPPRSASNTSSHGPTEEVRTLGDREVVKERLPNLALGKRFQLDNLTPQWSIESQMSQESSDGPQTHSEGTNRSDNQSRNSSKSSPGVNTENSNFNYSQSAIEEYTPSTEWSRHSNEDSLVDNSQAARRQSHDELANTLQEMSITNRENPAPEPVNKESVNAPPSVSPANFPPPSFMPPPTMPAPAMPPPPPATSGAGLPPPSSSSVLPPPTSFPQTSSSTNPFKQSGPFSHRKVPTASSSLQSFPPTSTNLISPNVVNKVSQHRVPVSFGANLETTPDNSERPDQPQMSAFRPPPTPQQVPDNLEIAPQNDRNEYLQTAHLSSGDYGENTDFSRNAPPPGFRRMVVGQQESEYSQNLNISGDEPPPGLARMVPGQQTEADNTYNQPDNYMERLVDGGPTTVTDRPYRQADGQQTDNYTQPPATRGGDRRPIGLDRMVPGEPSNDEYPQYQAGNYSSNEQRVVTGVDHDYPMPTDAGPTDIREQNVDGSDYSEATPRTAQRNVIGARESSDTPDFSSTAAPRDETLREVTMEGENLQDLSAINAADMTFARDHDATDAAVDRRTDLSDSIEHPTTSSRRQSLNRANTSADESDRDRAFKSSPRRDRDKHKSSRDRERDKDRAYSRGDRDRDRKFDRDREERRSGRDKDRDREYEREKREREESPHSRRHRRSTRARRYDTDDTDYYSDRERDRRSHREGSYVSKPPRPGGGERDRDRERGGRRYNTIERDRRPDDERERRRDPRDRHRHREERHDGRYRDIDPSRKHGNLRAERGEDRRRGELYSSASRPDSREGPTATATDEDLPDTLPADSRRRDRRSRHTRPDPYYEGYAAGAYPDAYSLQRQQYEYYERLRATDPHAYLQIYKQIMAGRQPALPAHLATPNTYMYGNHGYEPRAEDRGSVHSGRSSANGLKGNDTYYAAALGVNASLRMETSSLRDAPSLRTDLSDRELNTDASLNLHLEDSTVRSERMTPFKFSTAHIKGSISSRNIVVVRPSYPVDGLPATVHVMSLGAALARDPLAQQLHHYPGPLVKGVTHKMSVIEYCMSRVRSAGAARASHADLVGYVLLWELLALLLRQNGVVVGTDIAELLMKNTREYEYKTNSSKNSTHNESRRGSSQSGREEDRTSPEQPSLTTSDFTPQEERSSPSQPAVDEKAALDKLREYLTYGNRQEALEWAMSHGLWGHAMQLAGSMERRARANVFARFLAAVPRTDPLHTLYAHLQARPPPAAACVSDERWGDWRPHAAIMLANTSAKPDHDHRTRAQLGDSLLSRGLLYSAQFCYISAGVAFSRHPLAPLQPPASGNVTQPKLALLMGDARATTLAQLATNEAIFATEIYEYALSLNQDYVINELQVYKLILATRLIDVGQYERALGYTEAVARAVTRDPQAFAPAFIQQLADLADRLRYHDPALQDESVPDDGNDSAQPSPTHHQQWLEDVKSVAHMHRTEALSSQQATPQHNYYVPPPQQTWGDQTQQQQYQPAPTYPEPEENPDYSQYYQQQQPPASADQPPAPAPAPADNTQSYEEWARHEEQSQPHAQAQPYDNYWQGDNTYSYGEPAASAGGRETEAPRPMITMPGSNKPNLYSDYDGGEPDPSPENQEESQQQQKSQVKQQKSEKGKEESGKQSSGWLGGILNKLSLRAPNQMILPDDKNPTIVWDAASKRWRNLDGEEEGSEAAPPPPPTTRDLAPHIQNAAAPGSQQTPPPPGAPPAAPVSNIFKMQKGRHIKKSYVDVFNPSGAPTRALPPAAEVLGPPPAHTGAPAPNYFIPQPINHQTQLKLSIPSSPASSTSDTSTNTAAPAPSHPPRHRPTLRARHTKPSGYYDPSKQETDEDQFRSGI